MPSRLNSCANIKTTISSIAVCLPWSVSSQYSCFGMQRNEACICRVHRWFQSFSRMPQCRQTFLFDFSFPVFFVSSALRRCLFSFFPICLSDSAGRFPRSWSRLLRQTAYSLNSINSFLNGTDFVADTISSDSIALLSLISWYVHVFYEQCCCWAGLCKLFGCSNTKLRQILLLADIVSFYFSLNNICNCMCFIATKYEWSLSADKYLDYEKWRYANFMFKVISVLPHRYLLVIRARQCDASLTHCCGGPIYFVLSFFCWLIE